MKELAAPSFFYKRTPQIIIIALEITRFSITYASPLSHLIQTRCLF